MGTSRAQEARHPLGAQRRRLGARVGAGAGERHSRRQSPTGPAYRCGPSTNYFAGKYEAVAFRQIDRTRQSLAAFRERPADEPLWSAITEAMLAPLEAEGAADVRPTPRGADRAPGPPVRKGYACCADEGPIRQTGSTRSRNAPATDPVRDMYPRLVAAVVRAVGETAMEAYAYAEPPVGLYRTPSSRPCRCRGWIT